MRKIASCLLFFFSGLSDREHALLALREHHFVGAHALLAARHLVEIERDPEIAFGAHFHGRARKPSRAHVLNGDHAALLHDLETGLEQQLFRKRIAHLYLVGRLASESSSNSAEGHRAGAAWMPSRPVSWEPRDR